MFSSIQRKRRCIYICLSLPVVKITGGDGLEKEEIIEIGNSISSLQWINECRINIQPAHSWREAHNNLHNIHTHSYIRVHLYDMLGTLMTILQIFKSLTYRSYWYWHISCSSCIALVNRSFSVWGINGNQTTNSLQWNYVHAKSMVTKCLHSKI